jgi:magnesium transporter
VDHYEPILDYLEEALDELEERALTCPVPAVLTEIALKKRELLNLRRIVGPQREVVAQLTRGEVPFIRESTRVYLRDVQDHLIRTVEMIELYRDLVLGARDIYLSSISNRLNEIMKTLTIITVAAIPFTVVTGFYGMNFNEIAWWDRLLKSNVGFWLSVALVLALDVGIVYVFWRKGWLHRGEHAQSQDAAQERSERMPALKEARTQESKDLVAVTSGNGAADRSAERR